MKHCFQYLKRTNEYWLKLGEADIKINDYCDVDDRMTLESKAILVYLFQIDRATIS